MDVCYTVYKDRAPFVVSVAAVAMEFIRLCIVSSAVKVAVIYAFAVREEWTIGLTKNVLSVCPSTLFCFVVRATCELLLSQSM